MIPLKYNTRNLRARWVNTLATVLVTAVVVLCSCALFGLVDGLRGSLRLSGDPLDLIVLRSGSSNELNGGFDQPKADLIKTLEGIERDETGRPLCSSELVYIPSMKRVNGSRANVTFRGIELPEDGGTPPAMKLRRDFQIVQGRGLKGGLNECLVSARMAGRFVGTRLGETLVISDNEQYQVVGLFTAGGGAAESEIWLDLTTLQRNTYTEGTISSVQLRAVSPEARDQLRAILADDVRFKLDGVPEPEFYEKQTRAAGVLFGTGLVIAILLSFGALFAAANTMYAAVTSRTREIGTMRAIGFSRMSILVSFLIESILLCGLGGLIGLLATLPLTSLTLSTVNNFSEATFQFRIGPLVMGGAFLITLAVGVLGGLFPAMRALRLDVIAALRSL